MSKFATFWKNRSGSLRETTTMLAVAVTIVAVGAAMGLDHLTRDGGLPQIAVLPPAGKFMTRLPEIGPAGDRRGLAAAYDPTPVGSIPVAEADKIRLDPCTGERK